MSDNNGVKWNEIVDVLQINKDNYYSLPDTSKLKCDASGNAGPEIYCTDMGETQFKFNDINNIQISFSKNYKLAAITGNFKGNYIEFNPSETSDDDPIKYNLWQIIINSIPTKTFTNDIPSAELIVIYKNIDKKTKKPSYICVSTLMEIALPTDKINADSYQLFIEWGKLDNWVDLRTIIPTIDLTQLYPDDSINQFIFYINPDNSNIINLVITKPIYVPLNWINKIRVALFGSTNSYNDYLKKKNIKSKFKNLSKHRIYMINNLISNDTDDGPIKRTGTNLISDSDKIKNEKLKKNEKSKKNNEEEIEEFINFNNSIYVKYSNLMFKILVLFLIIIFIFIIFS